MLTAICYTVDYVDTVCAQHSLSLALHSLFQCYSVTVLERAFHFLIKTSIFIYKYRVNF